MSPQPLTQIPGGLSGCVLSPGEVSELHPDTALRITRYLAKWSWMDSVRERLAIALMKADHLAAYEMMAAVTSGPARTAATKAAAEATLPTNDYEMLDWVLDQMKPFDKQRHKFAHHLWLVAHKREDLVILLDPKYFSRAIVQERELNWTETPTGRFATPTKEQAERMEFFRKARYYTPKELDRMLTDASVAIRQITDLAKMLTDGHPEQNAARARLSADHQAAP